jgi:hypothetical protein
MTACYLHVLKAVLTVKTVHESHSIFTYFTHTHTQTDVYTKALLHYVTHVTKYK